MPGQPTSFRFTDEDTALFAALETSTGLSRLDLVRLALRLLARAWELAPPIARQSLPDELARLPEPGRAKPRKKNKSE
jgi:hypothetical protein